MRGQDPRRLIAQIENRFVERVDVFPLIGKQFREREYADAARQFAERVLIMRAVPVGVEFLIELFREFRIRLLEHAVRLTDRAVSARELRQTRPDGAVCEPVGKGRRLRDGGRDFGRARGDFLHFGVVCQRGAGNENGRERRKGRAAETKGVKFHLGPFCASSAAL